MKTFVRGCGGLLTLVAAACNGTYETITYEDPTGAQLLDDAPPAVTVFDEALTFTNRRGDRTNFSDKRFQFDIAVHRDEAERASTSALYASHAAALAARAVFGEPVLPSVQTVTTYLKQLDDTIYAGVEHAVQDGLAETVAPKRTILTGALQHLLAQRDAARDEASSYVAAALRLGGATVEVPADLEPAIADVLRVFEARPARSKPIGFYTWSEALRGIWKQDRLLQTELEPPAACALASALGADADRRARYEALVALYSRLTNPVQTSLVERLDIRGADCLARGPEPFLGTSYTAEGALYAKLYPGGIPPSADLMGDLITAIRGGTIDLAPRPEDGWYAHQTYALETLLVTDKSQERSKVAFSSRYKKRLQEAFQTIATQHRETHAKQTGDVVVSAYVPPPAPEFTVEPMATVYVRQARSYVFLEAALDALYPGLLDAATAVGERGADGDTVRARLHRARDLYFGFYLTSAYELGMLPVLDRTGDPTPSDVERLMTAAYAWAANLTADPIAAADVRVVVPVGSVGIDRTRYWAVVGVRTTLVSYAFIDESWSSPLRAGLPTEQFIEYTASATPPTREELRALCDAHPTVEAVKAALEKL